MSHTFDQTPSQGDKGKLLSSFSMGCDGSSKVDMSSTGSIWSQATSMAQVGVLGAGMHLHQLPCIYTTALCTPLKAGTAMRSCREPTTV
jgi:hypothetical protein